MVAPRAAPAGTPPTRAAVQTAATGRWSVQVAAFATSTMAESTRARVAQQLAQSAPNLAAEPRVARLNNRSYVLLGDFADRESAEALAGRLRAVLRQDVVVDRH
jgi:cell division protein FtsN